MYRYCDDVIPPTSAFGTTQETKPSCQMDHRRYHHTPSLSLLQMLAGPGDRLGKYPHHADPTVSPISPWERHFQNSLQRAHSLDLGKHFYILSERPT
ncbi:hypothetical protein CIHG_09155 [Coccidioides immitis H538.4]|uniref:Uncharacterized protein n=3 Tax=Coccidioides immitis TaxID=5501 RepID=A0A0J8TNC0_COCIT|nr:hypothetical protein CIRG_06591 [Coccidioides immitis RMSCC 2394]KMU75202.1 hypothetical protein CISG_04150 [Coccidioides immitis RMSCC 3703]KMU91410.1 hypothetical protein CIHG_09155 [Coccidioides immitis H538.4]